MFGHPLLQEVVHVAAFDGFFRVDEVDVLQFAEAVVVAERRAHAPLQELRVPGRVVKLLHDVLRELLVVFDGQRELAVAAAGLNVETADLVRDGRFFGEGGDVRRPAPHFVFAGGASGERVGAVGDGDPPGRAYFANVEEAEDGRDVGLVDAHRKGFKLVAVGVDAPLHARGPRKAGRRSGGGHFLVPQVLGAVEGGHVFEFKVKKLVLRLAVEPVQLAPADKGAVQQTVLEEVAHARFYVADEAAEGPFVELFRHQTEEAGFEVVHDDRARFPGLGVPKELNGKRFRVAFGVGFVEDAGIEKPHLHFCFFCNYFFCF